MFSFEGKAGCDGAMRGRCEDDPVEEEAVHWAGGEHARPVRLDMLEFGGFQVLLEIRHSGDGVDCYTNGASLYQK